MFKALCFIMLGGASSAIAQAPVSNVGLGFAVDTSAADVGPIVRLVRAYLAAPVASARDRRLWSISDSSNRTQRDLAARYALQGFPASIVGVTPADAGDSVYIVKILHARSDRAGGPVSPLALERLYAVRAIDGAAPFGWRLAAALPRLTKQWPTRIAGRITFHYAPGQQPDSSRAARAARFVDSVATLFAVTPPPRIQYYVTSGPDEYFRALGLDFFLLGSGRREGTAGNALPDVGVLLAGDPAQGEEYRHELVHIALGSHVRSGFVNEGIAAWLGGSRGLSAQQLYGALAAFQRAHPKVTWAALVRDKLVIPSEPSASSDAWYATGALMCEGVYRRAGVAGLRLLATTPNDVTALQHVLARLLDVADTPEALDVLWRREAPGFESNPKRAP